MTSNTIEETINISNSATAPSLSTTSNQSQLNLADSQAQPISPWAAGMARHDQILRAAGDSASPSSAASSASPPSLVNTELLSLLAWVNVTRNTSPPLLECFEYDHSKAFEVRYVLEWGKGMRKRDAQLLFDLRFPAVDGTPMPTPPPKPSDRRSVAAAVRFAASGRHAHCAWLRVVKLKLVICRHCNLNAGCRRRDYDCHTRVIGRCRPDTSLSVDQGSHCVDGTPPRVHTQVAH